MVFVRKFKGPRSEERVDCPVRSCLVTISKFRNLPKHLQTKHKFCEPIIKSIINQIRNCVAGVEDFCERNLPKNESSCNIQGKIPPIIDLCRRKNLFDDQSTILKVTTSTTTSTNDSRSPTYGNFPADCSTRIVSSFSHPRVADQQQQQREFCRRVSRERKDIVMCKTNFSSSSLSQEEQKKYSADDFSLSMRNSWRTRRIVYLLSF